MTVIRTNDLKTERATLLNAKSVVLQLKQLLKLSDQPYSALGPNI